MNVKGLFASWGYITTFQPIYFSEQKGNLHIHMVLVSNLGLGFILGNQTQKGTIEELPKINTIIKLEWKILT